MIDIHSHILPGIDDGSEDMEMSLQMARIYVENGISKVIATPHHIEGSVFVSLEERKSILIQLNKNLVKEAIKLEVFPGNEIYISMNIIHDIENRKAHTLNNTRYVLVELPMYDIPMYVENMIYELQLKGYIPIIAHPERNSKIVEDPNILYRYIENGALGQLNLPSLEGRYGKAIKATGEILLKHNMIHFVSTDAHSHKSRTPNSTRALDILSKLVSRDDFQRLTSINGNRLLEDKEIETKEPLEYKKKRSFLNIFKRKK